MKKFMALALAAMLVLSLAACGGSASSAAPAASSAAPAASATPSAAAPAADAWTFERNIEIVCPWGAGGGADTTLRTFAASLEKEIGVKVVINNKTGAGGTTGVEYAIQQPADGYTWLLCTQSPLLAQLTGAATTDVKGSIAPVVRLVHDTNVIVTGKNSPYNTFAELQEYIKAHPNEIKAGCMSITGLDGVCVKQAFGGAVEAIAYTEGAQLNSDVMAGHIALAVVGPAEIEALVASGDVKPILVCAEQRMSMDSFKNCEAAGELGIECFYGPYRGIFAANGTPEAAIKAFEAAAQNAVMSNEFQSWAATQGLDQRPGWQNTADFTATWSADTASLEKLVSEISK